MPRARAERHPRRPGRRASRSSPPDCWLPAAPQLNNFAAARTAADLSLAAGPGSDFSEVPALGCKPAALEPVAAPRCPPGPRYCCPGGSDHLAAGDVGEPAFQGAHRFHRRLPGGDLAVVRPIPPTVDRESLRRESARRAVLLCEPALRPRPTICSPPTRLSKPTPQSAGLAGPPTKAAECAPPSPADHRCDFA